MKHFSATDAKNRFGELLEASSNGPVAIVKNGREVAVMMSKSDFDKRSDKLSKKELIKKLHEESMERFGEVYEALAK